MTLEQYKLKYGCVFYSEKYATYYCDLPNNATHDQKWELYHLSNYKVSGQGSGRYWLIHKADDARINNA